MTIEADIIALHAPVKCLFASCITKCIGHSTKNLALTPAFVNYAQVGAHSPNEYMRQRLLRHALPRARVQRGDPYKNMRKDIQTSYTFKGQASRTFI